MPWLLVVLLRIKFSTLPKVVHHSLLLWNSIAACHAVRLAYKLPYLVSKHLSLGSHPEFSPGSSNYHFTLWDNRGIKMVAQLLHTQEGRFLTFEELSKKYSLPSSYYSTFIKH